jgi:hypothetical protein
MRTTLTMLILDPSYEDQHKQEISKSKKANCSYREKFSENQGFGSLGTQKILISIGEHVLIQDLKISQIGMKFCPWEFESKLIISYQSITRYRFEEERPNLWAARVIGAQ